MKVGDKIIANKIRPDDIAVVIKADVVIHENEGNKQTRSTYKARYNDGHEITFYGFNIGKSIFKYEEPDGQMSIEDFMNAPVEVMS